jgi:diacylglycerol kinase family enzyme
MRCLGEARLYVFAVWRLLKVLHYRCRFSWTARDQEGVHEGPLTYFIIGTLKHLSSGMKAFPRVQLEDGCGDAVMLSPLRTSWLTLIRVLLADDTGSHTALPGVESFKVQKWRLEPAPEGVFSIDGEVYPVQTVEGNLLPGGVIYVSRRSDS